MSKYLFKTKCPACGDGEITSWCHNSEKCGGVRYIDEDLYLHCNKCNDKTFLFNVRFNCGIHNFREPDRMEVMRMLRILGEFSDIPHDILEKMIRKAMAYD